MLSRAKRLAIISGLVTLLMATLNQPIPARAALSTCTDSGFAFNFDGKYSNTSGESERGAAAYLTVREAHMCTTNNSSDTVDSAAWVMLSATPTTNLCDGLVWSQIGYTTRKKTNGDKVIRFFWQWISVGSCDPNTKFWTDATYGPFGGSTYQFISERFISDGLIHLKIYSNGTPLQITGNGTVGPTTGYDPLDYWDEPIEVEYMEETKNTSLDFSGTANTRALFDGIQEKDKDTNTWVSRAFRVCDPSCHPATGWTWAWEGNGLGPCYAQQNDLNNTTSFEAWTSPQDHNC